MLACLSPSIRQPPKPDGHRRAVALTWHRLHATSLSAGWGRGLAPLLGNGVGDRKHEVDQGVVAIEKTVVSHSSQEEGTRHAVGAPWGSSSVGQEVGGGGKKDTCLTVVCGGGTGGGCTWAAFESF